MLVEEAALITSAFNNKKGECRECGEYTLVNLFGLCEVCERRVMERIGILSNRNL